jgi:hypothetical protein
MEVQHASFLLENAFPSTTLTVFIARTSKQQEPPTPAVVENHRQGSPFLTNSLHNKHTTNFTTSQHQQLKFIDQEVNSSVLH